MNCQRCKSGRVLEYSGKVDDRCFVRIGVNEDEGYAPSVPGISDGDYLEPSICLDCGQVQAEFPIPKTELEESFE